LQLNAMEPLIAYKLFDSIRLLGRAVRMLDRECIEAESGRKRRVRVAPPNEVVLEARGPQRAKRDPRARYGRSWSRAVKRVPNRSRIADSLRKKREGGSAPLGRNRSRSGKYPAVFVAQVTNPEVE
jgi:hypothetical protein